MTARSGEARATAKAPRDPLKTRRIVELVLTLAAPLLLLGVWELLSRTGIADPRFWPPPSTLWPAMLEMFQEGTLAADIGLTVQRILVGFALGTIPGVILGLAMGLFWPVRTFLMPIASAIYAVPKIAIIPLMIMAFGLGETYKWVTVALSIVFLVALSTMSGVLELDKVYRDVARNLGASRWELFRTVALPGAMPAIFSGMRLAMGFALIVVVGIEFVSATEGLGYLIWNSYEVLRMPQMFVGLVLAGFLGWGLTLLLAALERLAMPWRYAESRRADWKVWVRAVRIRSFTASTVPVVAATALAIAVGTWSLGMLVLMLIASIATHAASNLTNDYFDDKHGVDGTQAAGQGGMLQEGTLTHAQLRTGIVASFTIALVAALPVIAEVGTIIIWIGLLSAAAAFFYTAGPIPLAYIAMGEVTVFLAMGIGMVNGAYYVHTGEITLPSVMLSIAMGLLAAGFLHANNIRDRENDLRYGKRTLANLLSWRGTMIEYVLMLGLPFLCLIVLVWANASLWPALLGIVALPRAIQLIREMAAAQDQSVFNTLVRQSAGLHLLFGSVVSVGLLLAATI